MFSHPLDHVVLYPYNLHLMQVYESVAIERPMKTANENVKVHFLTEQKDENITYSKIYHTLK